MAKNDVNEYMLTNSIN